MKNFLFILLLLLGSNSIAQTNANTDSLKRVWNDATKPDTIRLQALHGVIRHEMYAHPDSAFYFAQWEYDFAKKIDNKQWMATALNTQGVASNFQGDLAGALKYYQKSLALRKEIDDPQGLANCLNNIGIIYDEQGNYNLSIDFYKQSLEIRQEMDDKFAVAASLNNIGIVYLEQENTEQALEYYLKSLAIRENINDDIGVGASLGNIGIVYKKRGELEKALEYYQKSKTINEKYNDKQGLGGALYNIANIYVNQGKIDSAFSYYHKSLKIKEDMGDIKSIPVTLNSTGLLYFEQGNLPKAKQYAQRSFKLSQETGNVVDMEKSSLLLSEIYDQENNKGDAFEMYKFHIAMRDSLKNEENHKATLRLTLQNEYEKEKLKKEQEEKEAARLAAEKLNRKNNMQYSGIGFGLLLLFVMLFFIGNLKLPKWAIELSVFLPFLILFEFLLVLTDPYLETWTGGEPVFKLVINATMAGLIFPIHSFFEELLKRRIFREK